MNDYKAASEDPSLCARRGGFFYAQKTICGKCKKRLKKAKKPLINEYVTDKIQMCGEKWSK
ncbi:MAG: hypothetical protein MJ103_02650 [Saccharofermentans sp.]|nr:hypothetical protein [Saccharofermentans sp.]